MILQQIDVWCAGTFEVKRFMFPEDARLADCLPAIRAAFGITKLECPERWHWRLTWPGGLEVDLSQPATWLSGTLTYRLQP